MDAGVHVVAIEIREEGFLVETVAIDDRSIVGPCRDVERIVVVGALARAGTAEERIAAVHVERVGEAIAGPGSGEDVDVATECAEVALVADVELDRVGDLVR